jgi:hypothetical protein
MKETKNIENMKNTSKQAETAKAIRKELKENFPSVKFQVRSESFAGGNSVDIRYTNGPITKEVDAIVRKYQYGHFDGMIDMYENSNKRDDIPQVKFVSVSREVTEDGEEYVKKIHNSLFVKECQISEDLNEMNEGFKEWNQTVLYRAVVQFDFTKMRFAKGTEYEKMIAGMNNFCSIK